jgi:eukaryotic-like serine/threonine-protein kinase
VHVGQVVSGKYRIERQIGRGGMGIVLAATHLQLGHLVAIKVMRRDLVVDDKVLDRLLMEARAAAKIRNEHVARVLDVGTLENGSPFIVMEYLEGENLADLLDREGALEVQQAVQFLLQCCLALAEVHAAEMVHRDLKPGNLFIARLPDGAASVKIVDFGISKYIGGPGRDGATTTSQQVMGSPFYMSPEQMRADPVDERSDIWGLGAILFEMLTGRPPFIGDTLPEVYSAVLNHAPPLVDSLRPGVPSGLDDVVQRCLEKNPGQRFCDVADLAEALSPYAGPAVWLVERVTRILTNPDAARPRHSLPGNDAVSVAGVVRVGGFQNAGEGIMDEDAERDEGEYRLEDSDFVVAPGQTVLESGASAELEPPWRPSRPSVASTGSTSGEVAPFSATGVHTGRVGLLGVLSRWRFAGLGAGLALVLGAGALWLARPAPPPEAEALPGSEPPLDDVAVAPGARPAETPRQEPASEPAPPERPVAAANEASEPIAQPRVTPIVAPSSRVQTRTHALKPAPVATKAVGDARPSSGAGETSKSSTAGADDVDWSEPSPAPAPAPARAASTRGGTDPWNPDSFGDRR